MPKTTTAAASAAKTTTSKTITKTKKVHHPWKGQNVAFVGPFIYQETEERTVALLRILAGTLQCTLALTFWAWRNSC